MVRDENTQSSPGFVPEKNEKQLVELHSWLKVLYTACQPSQGGGDWDVEVFLRALLEEERIVELFDWQPLIAAVIGRFVGRVSSSSSSAKVRRLARIAFKAFFLAEES